MANRFAPRGLTLPLILYVNHDYKAPYDVKYYGNLMIDNGNAFKLVLPWNFHYLKLFPHTSDYDLFFTLNDKFILWNKIPSGASPQPWPLPDSGEARSAIISTTDIFYNLSTTIVKNNPWGFPQYYFPKFIFGALPDGYDFQNFNINDVMTYFILQGADDTVVFELYNPSDQLPVFGFYGNGLDFLEGYLFGDYALMEHQGTYLFLGVYPVGDFPDYEVYFYLYPNIIIGNPNNRYSGVLNIYQDAGGDESYAILRGDLNEEYGYYWYFHFDNPLVEKIDAINSFKKVESDVFISTAEIDTRENALHNLLCSEYTWLIPRNPNHELLMQFADGVFGGLSIFWEEVNINRGFSDTALVGDLIPFFGLYDFEGDDTKYLTLSAEQTYDFLLQYLLHFWFIVFIPADTTMTQDGYYYSVISKEDNYEVALKYSSADGGWYLSSRYNWDTNVGSPNPPAMVWIDSNVLLTAGNLYIINVNVLSNVIGAGVVEYRSYNPITDMTDKEVISVDFDTFNNYVTSYYIKQSTHNYYIQADNRGDFYLLMFSISSKGHINDRVFGLIKDGLLRSLFK